MYYGKTVTTIVKSYNASSGLFTAYENIKTTIGHTEGWAETANGNYTVRAYLKYKPQ